MDILKFRQHLDEALINLLQLTREHCYNNLAESFRFIIEPSGREVHDDMNESEIKNLAILNTYKNKLVDAGKVVQLLWHDNKVPLWINTTVYESRPDLTVIHLHCSRRLREEYELYEHIIYRPFNILVALPPESLRIDTDGKFDVNWKSRWDKKQKSTWFKIKRLFSNQ